MLNSLAAFPIVFVIGVLAGLVINKVVAWLPLYLFGQWVREARDILECPLDHPPVTTPRVHHSTPRRLLVAMCSGLLSVVALYHFEPSPEGVAFMVLTWSLIAVSLIDADHQLIPDLIVIPLIWIGLIVNSFGFYATHSSALAGAVGGYLSLWFVAKFFQVVAGRDGIGHGDFKLLSVIGAWGGWHILPFTVFLAALLGVLVYVLNRCLNVGPVSRSEMVPFGPYISAAGWVAVVYSPSAISFFLI
ncbi:prepilin peptidase [Pseudomonas reactans]|uniref:prepilin peptidase n=1 Tax=Pseudomonas reactans TaxID=117680 RepID=UPI0015A2DDF0|nr:A24 family peptidase [Pseudomonas reactans]NWC90013.1 prepilin peptidase [Pseudomonas reactans]